MEEEEMMKETLLKEISLSANEYRLYKLREMTTSKLRNLYQEKLYYNEEEICKCIKLIMLERGCSL
jgi:hypothetical protein